MIVNPEKENELATLARKVWGDNAVEFLIGALSSVTTPDMFDALIKALKEQSEK
jgi:hypothetical protein